MTEHKFTDEEIIRALQVCVDNSSCKECPINPNHGNYGYCTNLALTYALDLINRQRAEIERLRERWVPAAEAKPVEADEYLVMIAGAKNPTVLHYDPDEEAFYEEGLDDEAIWYPVTHWAELPEGALGTPVATKEAVKRCATCRYEDRMAEEARCIECEKHNLWEERK